MTNLTKKEKVFVKEYLDTGNGTQAALKAYDTDSPNMAAVIASRTIRKDKVIEYIASKAEVVAEVVYKLATESENESIKLNASKDILDRAGFKPVDKAQNVNIDITAHVSDPRLKELNDKYNREVFEALKDNG